MLVLALLLAPLQGAPAPAAPPGEGFPVPAFVVPQVQLEDGAWIENLWRSSGDDVHVAATRLAPDTLEILVSDFDHLSGDDVRLRLSVAPGGAIGVEACSTWHTDVGDPNSGPNTDLHGEVLVEARGPGDSDPLRLSFHLHGLRVGFLGRADPVLLRGAAEVSLDGLGWSAPIASPAPPGPGATFAETDLREGEWTERWDDGSLRARGSHEADRATGPWIQWWPNGNEQWEGDYDDGEPVGTWTCWNEDGSLKKTVTRKKMSWSRK